MQLPPADEIVMVAGTPPIRAKKARYYEDRRIQERIISPPNLVKPAPARPDDWSTLPLPATPAVALPTNGRGTDVEATTAPEPPPPPELTRAHPPQHHQPITKQLQNTHHE